MDFFRALPAWSVQLVFAAICIAILGAVGAIWKRVSPRAGPGEVRAAPTVIGSAMLAVFCGLLVGWLGTVQREWAGESPEVWLGSALICLGLGATILWFQRGAIITYDDHGVTPRGQERRPWHTLRVREATMGPGLVIKFRDRRPLGLAAGSDGLEPFLIKAFELNVPGTETLVRRAPSDTDA